MTFVRKSYEEITDSILSQITKGIVNERYEHVRNRSKYRLAYPNVRSIVKIEGLVKGDGFIFRKGTDYRHKGNVLEWTRDGLQPDDRTQFKVSYKIDVPAGITDVNPGSVVRTIVESIALEMDYLYAQMDQSYKAGFIDTANRRSLDLTVSILGITRKSAGYAAGEITFGRRKEPASVEVQREAHAFDGKDRYELKKRMIRSIKKVDGTSAGSPAIFAMGSDFTISKGMIVWTAGKKPDMGTLFYVDYVAYEPIIIPADTRVSTFSRKPENVKTFRTTKDAVLKKNKEGRWEVDIPVMAVTPGKEGNVFAGSVTVMPKPVMGVEYVINKKDILNGTDVESDEDLRERARHALETAGKATIMSLKSAVQGIDGVTGEVVVIDQPDGVPGVVQVIASGGNDQEIARVIEETRAAGIVVEFKRPINVPVDVRLSITVFEGIDAQAVKKDAEKMARRYMASLNIGEDAVISRIIKAVLTVPGVRDARGVTLNDKAENVDIKPDEKAELRIIEIFQEG